MGIISPPLGNFSSGVKYCYLFGIYNTYYIKFLFIISVGYALLEGCYITVIDYGTFLAIAKLAGSVF